MMAPSGCQTNVSQQHSGMQALVRCHDQLPGPQQPNLLFCERVLHVLAAATIFSMLDARQDGVLHKRVSHTERHWLCSAVLAAHHLGLGFFFSLLQRGRLFILRGGGRVSCA
jgi:hypothetical protein